MNNLAPEVLAQYQGRDLFPEAAMDMHRSPRPKNRQQEILDRVRRLETRFTTLMIAMGYDTNVERAAFHAGELRLTSPHASLKECLSAIPEAWSGPVKVFINNEYLVTLTL